MKGSRFATAPPCAALLALALSTLAAAPPVRAAELRVPYSTFTLANGLKVILHEDHSLPIVTVNTWYHVGSGDEKPGRTGFAHLFEHIMFMGSQHVPTGEFDRLLEAAGGDNNGSTTGDRTNYFEDGPTNALPLMLWLDSDRMGFLLPEMTAEKVDLQRGVVQNERRQSYENQPYGLATENVLKRLYPAGHPYSWPVIGSMADLSAASLDDVKEFFRHYYTPNDAVVSIAGDIDPAATRRLVERWFGAIPRGPEVKRATPAPFALGADSSGVLEDRVQVPRVYDVWHSLRAYAPDDAPLSVAAEILGGGKSSRLYRRLVYELEIASDVYAYQNGHRMDGEFWVVATARPGHGLGELQKVILDEVRRLADEGPTPREIGRVANQAEATMFDAMQRIGGFGGLADRLNAYEYFTGTPDYFARDLERFRQVTAADVQRVTRQYLADPHKVVLSVVPQGKTDLAVSEGRKP